MENEKQVVMDIYKDITTEKQNKVKRKTKENIDAKDGNKV